VYFIQTDWIMFSRDKISRICIQRRDRGDLLGKLVHLIMAAEKSQDR
jgi:hypothetical protein